MRSALAFGRRGAMLGAIATVAIASGLHAQAPPGPGDAAKPTDQAAPAAASVLKNVEQLPPNTAVAILGKKAQDASGHDMGPIVDVLVGPDGQPRAAVIDFGGFLGVGSRKIAIDWALLQFKPDDPAAPVVLALDRAMVQAAPEYKPAPQLPVQIVGPPPAPTGTEPSGGK